MAAFIVPWYGNYLFPSLDYNCFKDKVSFLCIFAILAPSKEPGTEMLHAQLLWLTHSANEAKVLNPNLCCPGLLLKWLCNPGILHPEWVCYCLLRCLCSMTQVDRWQVQMHRFKPSPTKIMGFWRETSETILPLILHLKNNSKVVGYKPYFILLDILCIDH